MIDLKRLHHLTVLVQHGNFHRAAEALHLTQPALSRSIQALEAHVGAPLLARHRTGVEPTELGGCCCATHAHWKARCVTLIASCV